MDRRYFDFVVDDEGKEKEEKGPRRRIYLYFSY